MSVTSASNLCFLSGHPLISIRTNVHKIRRLWLVTDIHAYIADFNADIADVCADIAKNHADVRNFSQCPLHVPRASADIWDTGMISQIMKTITLAITEINHKLIEFFLFLSRVQNNIS